MPTPPLTRQTCFEAVLAVRRFIDRGYQFPGPRDGKNIGAIAAAAKSASIPETTFHNRVKQADLRFGITPDNVLIPPDEWDDEDGEREDPLYILERAKV